MSDVDDLPDLVDSSDEEKDRPPKCGADHADVWLGKPEKFLKQQEHWMRVFCLSPFLFGVDNILPAAWTRALVKAELLLQDQRKTSIDYLTWEELECVDLMEVVIVQVQKQLRNKQRLGNVIDFINRVDEDRRFRSGVIIDVETSVREAEKSNDIRGLWRDVLRTDEAFKKEKPTKFAVLYGLRLYAQHVLVLSRHSKNFVDEVKNELKSRATSPSAEKLKEMGNECFKYYQFDQAINFYTDSCMKEPHNHIYYGNRAQAYLKLDNKMMYALADGRRAVTIKPEFAKGHYRYALSFYRLGRLDSAIQVNEQGLKLCKDTKQMDQANVDQLSTQRDEYVKEKQKRDPNKTLTPMPAELGKTLDSLNSWKPSPDLNEKFKCEVPQKESSTVKKYQPDTVAATGNLPNGLGVRTVPSIPSVPIVNPEEEACRKKEEEKKDFIKPDTVAATGNLPNGLGVRTVPSIPSVPIVNPEEEACRKKEEEKKDFMKHLTEGSDSMSKHVAKEAMTCYHKALDMLLVTGGPEHFGLDESDLVTLKYAFGSAAVQTGQYKHIIEGIEKFNDIIENHVDVRFPLAYYGLGKAFVILNRFSDALHPISNGIQAASSVKYSDVTWPGTKQLIAENESKTLVGLLKDLLQLCKCPPAPDAVCRYHSETAAGDNRSVIYLTDPDFKGYTKMLCQMNCVLFFHPICWKEFKSSYNKHTDKEMFESLCPTPDCPGLIVKLEIMRPDGVTREYLCDKYQTMKEAVKNRKSILNPKQKTSSEAKIAKKQEKKEQRKQRRRQLLEETDDLTEEDKKLKEEPSHEVAASTSRGEELSHQPVDQHHQVSMDTTILRKDDITLPKTTGGKSKRSKKKKDKGRQVLAVEVNFNDKKEGMLLNENSVLSDEEEESSSQRNANPAPFSVPTELKKEIKQFENSYTGNQKPLFKPDNITENLFSFFVEILNACGPLEITDAKIQQELEVFPVEALEKIKQAGGLADFLRQSLKFAVIDNIVSLMSDAKKAREVALSKRNSGQGPDIQNAWQTVGKGAQNVDSLSESLTVSNSGIKQNVPKTMSFSSVTGISVPLGTSSFSSYPKSSTPDPSVALSSSIASSQGTSFKVSPSNSSFPGGGTKMNTLDSIDDFPIETRSRSSHGGMDDLDDFDTISHSGSGYSGSASKPVVPKLEIVRSTETMSRSSSRSDISDSSRSDFSSGMMPKPMRPSGDGVNTQDSSRLWNKLESDFDLSFSKVSNEGLDNEKESQFESVGKELQKATEEFVRKSDETFVAEIAESVVDKMIQENGVSLDKKAELLEKISKDIWKDFEKSANAGKSKTPGMWANTPASDEYSKNVGDYANEFMKKHYRTSELSNFSALYPQPPYMDSGNLCYKLPSASTAWSTGKDDPFVSDSESAGSVFPVSSSSTSFNMFSGLSWGTDSSNNKITSDAFSIPPPIPSLVLPQKQFIRPPPMATSFYGGTSRFPPPLRLPMQRAPMPPQMTMMATGMTTTTEKKDKETQCVVHRSDAECMTDPYEPYKMEYQMMGEERDRLSQLLDNSNSQYEQLTKDFIEKEMSRKALEVQLGKSLAMFEQQKHEWQRIGEKYTQEQKQLQHMILVKDSQEKLSNEKIEMLQAKLQEQARLVQEQREREAEEKHRMVERYQQLCSGETSRARNAEMEVLRVRMKSDKGRLLNQVKDATLRHQHLGLYIKKCNDENRPVPGQLQQQYDYLKSVMEKLEENSAKITREYEGQISEIQAGKLLSELQPIKVPSPPPIPDAMKSSMNPSSLMLRMPPSVPNRSPVNPYGVPGLPSPASLTNGTTSAPSPQNVLPSSGIQAPSVQPPGLSAPSLVTPRPLTHPNFARGMSPLRPLSGFRAATTGPNRPPLRPLSGQTLTQPMTSFDKLVMKLERTFPSKARSDFPQLIQELRSNHNGSLSGMTLDDIVGQIGDMIARAERKNTKPQMEASQRTVNPPPGLSSWAFLAANAKNEGSSGTRNIELFQEDEDPCVICHEEMTDKPARTLECCHTFHDECIRKWFQEQSTCPNCRVHTLLSDEFPSLG